MSSAAQLQQQKRKAQYALDESQIKPYFELDRVLQDGVFFAANQLYGLTFKERKDLPVYQPDVRVFEVFVEGAKDGFNVAVRIIPYLVAILAVAWIVLRIVLKLASKVFACGCSVILVIGILVFLFRYFNNM